MIKDWRPYYFPILIFIMVMTHLQVKASFGQGDWDIPDPHDRTLKNFLALTPTVSPIPQKVFYVTQDTKTKTPYTLTTSNCFFGVSSDFTIDHQTVLSYLDGPTAKDTTVGQLIETWSKSAYRPTLPPPDVFMREITVQKLLDLLELNAPWPVVQTNHFDVKIQGLAPCVRSWQETTVKIPNFFAPCPWLHLSGTLTKRDVFYHNPFPPRFNGMWALGGVMAITFPALLWHML